jgi:hypothetical protein
MIVIGPNAFVVLDSFLDLIWRPSATTLPVSRTCDLKIGAILARAAFVTLFEVEHTSRA